MPAPGIAIVATALKPQFLDGLTPVDRKTALVANHSRTSPPSESYQRLALKFRIDLPTCPVRTYQYLQASKPAWARAAVYGSHSIWCKILEI
jgi:hypothetical protein